MKYIGGEFKEFNRRFTLCVTSMNMTIKLNE